MAKFRKEKDSLGEVVVENDRYFGIHTARTLENFLVGSEKMPKEMILGYVFVKKTCAIVNHDLGFLSQEKKDWISQACDEILEGKLDDHFPLLVWQAGAGTAINMNCNEVIANRAIEIAGGIIGSKTPVHPNDDVNMSQSSNDTFPTAMHIASVLLIKRKLLPHLQTLIETFEEKIRLFDKIYKVGRTHLMDAVPVTLGQELSAYSAQLKNATASLKMILKDLSKVVLGGTAIGTGINAHPEFTKKAAIVLSELTKESFFASENLFASISASDAVVTASGILKTIATVFFKLANDLTLLGSGPRCGLGELKLPENEPGSSIMPGKINPTQCEAMKMVAAQIIGNDATITFAAAGGQLSLNALRPVIAYNFIQSIHLIADMALNFAKKCIKGLKPNIKRMQKNLQESLMLATFLNKKIGYDKAAKIVRKAHLEDLSLKEATLSLGFLNESEFQKTFANFMKSLSQKQ